ncbi:hypothetical protein COV11_02915 [Candidatus Woesearchaeota archaeon CG10_big_fil_rev_8_21_14_0_10_30_7]|nr:MAG: hypothetical protein COV11_02915 [Candidatus Woesearchaeota archaeon CG10_big_fil_rev_8_21_14_0_10_30_7]
MNPAVLVIDMQEHFIGYNNPDRDLLIPSQLNVLTYCAQQDIPVIKIEYGDPWNKTISELSDACKKYNPKRDEYR